MILALMNLQKEDRLFYDALEARYNGGIPNGEEMLTYATKVSNYSMILIFLSHFSIALIFCQIVEVSSFAWIFIVPMVIQLINLFYISKILGMQLRVISLDKF
jgi:hypothetical protein